MIRHAEQVDAGLARLAALFTQDIPGKVHIQLFVTPAGTHGFGWHYDDEDVFIVQTEGSKDYFFRDNTVERDRPLDAPPDFTQFGPEVSARVLAGTTSRTRCSIRTACRVDSTSSACCARRPRTET